MQLGGAKKFYESIEQTHRFHYCLPSYNSEECNVHLVDRINKSIKLRWGNVLRHHLPEIKLPISAIWRCRIGVSETYALGSCKELIESPYDYLLCDITKINYFQLTASAYVFYPGKNEPKEVLDIYLHEFSLVNMDLAEGPGDDGDAEKVTESEMKNANMLLDHMRFFFNIVWFPWDEREEEDMNDFYEMCDSTDENWVSMHLAFRIQAYEEHVQNQTDTFDQLKKLANEHDSLAQRQKNIARYHDDDTNQDIQDLIVVEGLEIDDQLDNIKKRADRHENPSLYKAFQNVARFRKKEGRNAMLSDYYGINQLAEKKAICFVLGKKVNMQGIVEFMSKAQQKVGFDVKLTNIIYRESLQLAINACLPGDYIILPPGEHVLNDWGDFKEGGYIYGIDATNPSLIELHTIPGRFGIEISYGAVLENVIISSSQYSNNDNDCSYSTSVLDESMIPGEGISEISLQRHGLLVKNGFLQMRNCTLLGLDCAINVAEGAELSMKNCKLDLNEIGIKIEHMAGKITLEDVTFDGSTETNKDKYGIVVVDNMLGKNLTFKNVGLRYGHGHFVFIEPKFFSKKSKNRSELCFKNSWEDVHPLLSKSSKTNLSLSYPYQYKKFDYLNATEHSDVHSLMVVADFSFLSGVNERFILPTKCNSTLAEGMEMKNIDEDNESNTQVKKA